MDDGVAWRLTGARSAGLQACPVGSRASRSAALPRNAFRKFNEPNACAAALATCGAASRLAEGRQLARRAIIVDPENPRSVRPLALRGGPTNLRHRSDQLAPSGMLGALGDIARDRRERTHCARVFLTRDGSIHGPCAS